MSLLKNKKSKEEKKQEKQQEQLKEFMEKYQLEDLDEKDMVVLQRIVKDLMLNGLLKTSMALTFAKVEEQAKINYLATLVDQNWMIIRQLSRLNKNIEELLKASK